ncbi:MAG: hypothetical protein QOF02_143 [Blastocatellia bacterium]|jgi:hypothetical protein|nr:hypothetical protein [Blastocatellia bacterium]
MIRATRADASQRNSLRPAPDSADNVKTAVDTVSRAAKARTRDELDKASVKAIQLVTKAEIQGWFTHCGYSVACK